VRHKVKVLAHRSYVADRYAQPKAHHHFGLQEHDQGVCDLFNRPD
jgi:hypothetical protein